MNIPAGFVGGLALGGFVLTFVKNPRLDFILGFPGIFCHELAHYLVALLLLANPKPMKLFPVNEGNGRWRLGSVEFTPSWWSAGPAALAPLYVLPPLVYLLFQLAPELSLAWQIAAGYFAIDLAWGAFPSLEDWGIALRYPVGALIVLGWPAMEFLLILHGKG